MKRLAAALALVALLIVGGVEAQTGPFSAQIQRWAQSVGISSDGAGGATLVDLTVTAAGDTVAFGDFTRNHHIRSSAARAGVTGPTETTVGTSRVDCFDADAEELYFVWEVPSDWAGGADMQLLVEWFPESGVAMADTETVIWSTQYRSKADGEAVTAGTAVTATATYTQSGAGTDLEIISTTITLDYDDVNQPIAAGDHLYFQFDRDFTGDSYASDGCIFQWMVVYQSTGLSTGGA
jgi:hypothetical protein